MKKFFLLLTALVLGLSQLYADEVTFSASTLKATLPSDNSNISIPYTWKTSPYHVSVNIAKKDGTTATLGVSNVIAMNGTFQFTVSVAGKGTLNSIKLTTDPSSQSSNVSANAGTYSSGTWTPGETSISSVTFTCTGTFRLTQIAVEGAEMLQQRIAGLFDTAYLIVILGLGVYIAHLCINLGVCYTGADNQQ